MGLGFINLKIWEFENLKMGGLLHFIFKSSNSQIFKLIKSHSIRNK
jgi:hypothetical protein